MTFLYNEITQTHKFNWFMNLWLIALFFEQIMQEEKQLKPKIIWGICMAHTEILITFEWLLKHTFEFQAWLLVYMPALIKTEPVKRTPTDFNLLKRNPIHIICKSSSSICYMIWWIGQVILHIRYKGRCRWRPDQLQ